MGNGIEIGATPGRTLAEVLKGQDLSGKKILSDIFNRPGGPTIIVDPANQELIRKLLNGEELTRKQKARLHQVLTQGRAKDSLGVFNQPENEGQKLGGISSRSRTRVKPHRARIVGR